MNITLTTTITENNFPDGDLYVYYSECMVVISPEINNNLGMLVAHRINNNWYVVKYLFSTFLRNKFNYMSKSNFKAVTNYFNNTSVYVISN